MGVTDIHMKDRSIHTSILKQTKALMSMLATTISKLLSRSVSQRVRNLSDSTSSGQNRSVLLLLLRCQQ